MKKFLLPLCFVFVFCAFASEPALAARKKKEAASSIHPTVIASVSPSSITITEANVNKTFAITQFTEITLKGQPAKLSDLQPGMSVSVGLSTDPNKLSRINAGDAPVGSGSSKR